MSSASTSRNDAELLKLVGTLQQALAEMDHAHRDPNWFTKGREGADAQFRLWSGRGAEAITALKSALSENEHTNPGDRQERQPADHGRVNSVRSPQAENTPAGDPGPIQRDDKNDEEIQRLCREWWSARSQGGEAVPLLTLSEVEELRQNLLSADPKYSQWYVDALCVLAKQALKAERSETAKPVPCGQYSKGHATDNCGNCGKRYEEHSPSSDTNDEEIQRLCREWWSARSQGGGSASFIDEAFTAGFKAAQSAILPTPKELDGRYPDNFVDGWNSCLKAVWVRLQNLKVAPPEGGTGR